jgi:hypothetical protein
MAMSKILKFEEHQNTLNEEIGMFVNDEVTNNDNRFGVVNIHIDGNGTIKNMIIPHIKKVLKNLQGERHLFVDDKEINPYN